ncbi:MULTISPECIES: DUF2768 domain-containing protein [Cytobacillus]|uniref:NAD(FAD)-dependent dehydrogenase n=1 Tax=Cytobacillus oceanisediminis 2691 TaxID=1196031 RepID=A0A160MDS4_9BACI|nr:MULTISPECIES: DUF2768 domain-containing protein [Cytobacillus]MBY0154697.1 DUF2768 domain-containing protein [Cytobacillus firmus]AND41249.1 hypothetical protein A361_19510 [Cytobacillus oceanisediminis 2691]MCM3393916.1 DUF2768 domain-containing protein [Cytobacillus oceanisediminis]MCM3532074.1 DUF2768 domain-containing protein [Cytobacillus oceanisediminis]UQX54566.1 DUF2768 domain-containing protein [Cytobacillus pseudoceanisediminis]
MSPALMKMWISLASMGFMFLSIILIYLSRYKLKPGVFKIITAIVAYFLMIISGIIIVIVVFSGPTSS